MSTIHFNAALSKPEITRNDESSALLTLPQSASNKLPSRGTTMVEGTLNGVRFRAVLEPDGQGSHWFTLGKTMQKIIGANVGDPVTLEIEPTKKWPEPETPANLEKSLADDPEAYSVWMSITTMARWEWIRWVGSAKLPETRKERHKRICSMLKAGKRRPCCFNRSLQTPPKSASMLDAMPT